MLDISSWRKSYYFAKNWGAHGPPGPPGSVGPVFNFLASTEALIQAKRLFGGRFFEDLRYLRIGKQTLLR